MQETTTKTDVDDNEIKAKVGRMQAERGPFYLCPRRRAAFGATRRLSPMETWKEEARRCRGATCSDHEQVAADK